MSIKFLFFSWIVNYRKIYKNRFKMRGSPCYFLSFRDKKIKNITNIEHTVFVYTLSFIFCEVLLLRLIYTINIWFNLVLGSYFEHYHPLNLITLRVYAKCVLVHLFQNRNWFCPKLDGRIFFRILTFKGPFCRNDFNWKKIWEYGVNFWKNRSFVSRT